MLTENDLMMVQNEIGYTFINKGLLMQAFRRSSYAKEQDVPSNEILEFIGDGVILQIVIKKMAKKYCSTSPDKDSLITLNSAKNPKDFTDIKKELISNERFAEKITSLGWNKYLITNKSDKTNDVCNKKKPKADLFEAIIGAVAVDCNYNMRKLDKVVSKLLDLKKFLEEHK